MSAFKYPPPPFLFFRRLSPNFYHDAKNTVAYFIHYVFLLPYFLYHIVLICLLFVVDTPLQRLKRKLLTKSEDKDQKKRKGRGKKRAILLYNFFFTYQTFMMHVQGERF